MSMTTVTSTISAQESTGKVFAIPQKANGGQNVSRIPRPESLEDQRKWQLEQMAGAFRIFAKLGFADGASGHISLRGKHPQLVAPKWSLPPD